LLRESSQHTGEQYDLKAVTKGARAGETGIPCGSLLIEFAEAVLGVDDEPLARARAAIAETLGEAALVDAAGIVGFFNAIDRVADATGTPLDAKTAKDTEGLRNQLGINEFAVRS
jgi:hypothetical protein